jgi:hypothetical protein
VLEEVVVVGEVARKPRGKMLVAALVVVVRVFLMYSMQPIFRLEQLPSQAVHPDWVEQGKVDRMEVLVQLAEIVLLELGLEPVVGAVVKEDKSMSLETVEAVVEQPVQVATPMQQEVALVQ